MPLQAEDIADLAIIAQKELGKMKWTEIATDLQEHVILPQILQKEKAQFGSGTAIQWNIMTDHNHSARHVGLLEPDNVNMPDTMTTASIPWRHCTANYGWDEREIAMNSGPATIVDSMKKKRAECMISLAEELETKGFEAPSSSSNVLDPYGILYWNPINTSPTLSDDCDFEGTLPSGHTTIAGLDPSSQTRWSNCTGHATDVTYDALVKVMRKAAYLTNFKSPIQHPSYARGPDRYVIFTNYEVESALTDVVRGQNENIGPDLARYDGQVVFHKNKVMAVPFLDANTSNPVLGINWAQMYPVFLRGFFLKETKPKTAPLQHNGVVVHIDLTWNWVCKDRRRLWALTTAIL